ncbi:MAG: hypothetical protein GY777_27895 [Candidatus Brocadiaceae bacterium]|nr:hypothetical protein [Candidatus Brocadiaceae bacterium]
MNILTKYCNSRTIASCFIKMDIWHDHTNVDWLRNHSMVSLVRVGCALSFILIIIVIFVCTATAMAGDQTLQQTPSLQTDTIELKYGKMSFTLESGANFLSRRDSFGYVFSFASTGGTPVTGGQRINYDSLGGSGKFTIGYPIKDNLSLEFSFQGTSAGSERSGRLVSVNGGGHFDGVPVIDGQRFDSNDQLLLLYGNYRTKLEYESWNIDTFIGLDRTALKKSNTELHTIVGMSYVHFEQDFEHEAIGTNTLASLPVSSDLDEDLRDNLFGLKGGLRLNSRVTRKIQIEGSVFGGAYYRKSKLDADQELINVSAVSGGTIRDINASVNDRDNHFVPMTEGTLKVKYKINDRWNLAFSSGVNAWWNMSRVNNPRPRSGNIDLTGNNFIDEPTHIDNDDRLMDYHIGLAIMFRH